MVTVYYYFWCDNWRVISECQLSIFFRLDLNSRQHHNLHSFPGISQVITCYFPAKTMANHCNFKTNTILEEAIVWTVTSMSSQRPMIPTYKLLFVLMSMPTMEYGTKYQILCANMPDIWLYSSKHSYFMIRIWISSSVWTHCLLKEHSFIDKLDKNLCPAQKSPKSNGCLEWWCHCHHHKDTDQCLLWSLHATVWRTKTVPIYIIGDNGARGIPHFYFYQDVFVQHKNNYHKKSIDKFFDSFPFAILLPCLQTMHFCFGPIQKWKEESYEKWLSPSRSATVQMKVTFLTWHYQMLWQFCNCQD